MSLCQSHFSSNIHQNKELRTLSSTKKGPGSILISGGKYHPPIPRLHPCFILFPSQAGIINGVVLGKGNKQQVLKCP